VNDVRDTLGLPWSEPDPELLGHLARNGALAAAEVAMRPVTGTMSDRDREVISAALRALLAAGLITALPLDQWPEYVCLEPPG
jgi:hypothetical protein